MLSSSLLPSSQCPCSRLVLLLQGALLRCPVLYTLSPALLHSPQSMAPSLFCPYPTTLGSLLSYRVSAVVPKTNSVTYVPAPHLNQSLFPAPSTVPSVPKWLPNTRQPLSGPLPPSFWLSFFLSNVHLGLTQTFAGSGQKTHTILCSSEWDRAFCALSASCWMKQGRVEDPLLYSCRVLGQCP